MSTPESKVTTASYEPYKNYRFRVKWDGLYIAGFTKVSGLSRGQVIDHRAGGDPDTAHVLPGESDYGPVTLERGVTYDIAFQQWANKVWDYANAGSASASSSHLPALQDFRKEIVIELYNEAGQRVIAYNIHRCWPSEFTAIAELDGIGNAVAIQALTLQHEGWERDSG